LIIAASCAIAAAVVILIWKLLYRLFDHGDGGVETKYGIETKYSVSTPDVEKQGEITILKG
jgi:hypothetical protein